MVTPTWGRENGKKCYRRQKMGSVQMEYGKPGQLVIMSKWQPPPDKGAQMAQMVRSELKVNRHAPHIGEAVKYS